MYALLKEDRYNAELDRRMKKRFVVLRMMRALGSIGLWEGY